MRAARYCGQPRDVAMIPAARPWRGRRNAQLFRYLVFGFLGVAVFAGLVVAALAAVFLFLLLVFLRRFVRGIAAARTSGGPEQG